MVWCGLMWHIFPRGDPMEKYREERRICHRKPREEKKKKKNKRTQNIRETQATRSLGFFHPVACRPGRAWPRPRSEKPKQRAAWVACDLGGALPGFFSPKLRTTQAAPGPGRARPKQRTTQVASYYLRLMVRNQIRLTWFWVSRFFLPSDLIVVIVDFFFFFLFFFVYFGLFERLKIFLNFVGI